MKIALPVFLLFILFFYLITATHLFTDEEIVGNDIVRFKELYIEPLFSGEGLKYKFNKRKVGWASNLYTKTECGQLHDYRNGLTFVGCTMTYTTRDKYYYP